MGHTWSHTIRPGAEPLRTQAAEFFKTGYGVATVTGFIGVIGLCNIKKASPGLRLVALLSLIATGFFISRGSAPAFS